MRRNPEFVRNLWLVHSPLWLVLIPLILGAFFIIAFAAELAGIDLGFDDHRPTEFLAFMLFLLSTLILGSGQAISTIREELSNHTWDGQRMSAIGPWSMAWGKLFGSTAYAWYSAFICMAFYALTSLWASLPIAYIAKSLVIWVAAGIIMQAYFLATILTGLQKAPVSKRDRSFGPGGAMVSLSFAVAAVPAAWFFHSPDQTMPWFGWRIGLLDVILLSAVVYAGWALASLYFAMRRELQFTNSPLVWLGFAMFTVVYAAGFGEGDYSSLKLLPFFVGLLLLFEITFSEPNGSHIVRRIGRYARQGEWRTVFDLAPRTAFTLALVAAVVLWFIAFGEEASRPSFATDKFLVAALLFAARDVGMIFYLNMTYSSKRAILSAMGYVMLLYAIAPSLANLSSLPLLSLFWPVPGESVLVTIGPVFLQAAIIYFFLFRRVRAILTEEL